MGVLDLPWVKLNNKGKYKNLEIRNKYYVSKTADNTFTNNCYNVIVILNHKYSTLLSNS